MSAGFALHGEEPSDPVLGKLVQRGLDDELKGTAYVIVAGVDGHTHHLRFGDLEFTGDAPPGAIVEARVYDDANGRRRLSLATRSDLTIAEQVTASGATWLDRQLLAKDPPLSGGGFGAEVREAMEARIDHLVEEGLARRQGQRVIFARDLLATLQRRELEETATKLAARFGAYLSTCWRGGAARRRLSRARDAGVRPLRHDRRWAGLPARAMATGAREGSRPRGPRCHGGGRTSRLGPGPETRTRSVKACARFVRLLRQRVRPFDRGEFTLAPSHPESAGVVSL